MNVLDLSSVDPDDRGFVTKRLALFSFEIQRILLTEYCRQPTKFERNTYLRVTSDTLSNHLSVPLDKVGLNLTEEDLRDKAKRLAASTLALRRQHLSESVSLVYIRQLVKQQGLPVNAGLYSHSGELARYSDPKWWLRKLRKALRRNIETVLHHLNQINKKTSLYCSYPTLIARRNQRAYQNAYLENTFAVNELGQRFSLLELAQKGVSDPKIRKAELMVRARGFEDLAQELNHVATFLTLTCPSKYHRSYSASGHANPKWGGFTPLDGHSYLNKVWQLIRSKLNRLGVRFYGFRVAEPQHDGTPHWHLLLFVEPESYRQMIEVIQDYALREDSKEKGATEHRFTEIKIDPSKGSATGYIAKYISKNIDGTDLDKGVYEEDPQDAAARVDAWAACWGIRQFQQLGGCSVTVWRELRRLKERQGLPLLAQGILKAADKSDWKRFTEMMGGVFSLRKEQVCKPYYALSFDLTTGVIKSSLYDENEMVRVLKGVMIAGHEIITRTFQWRLESTSRYAF
ncbi:putative replication protein [Vibrio chagasii]|nr:putative replication protein [Vibrio chagasii]